MVQIKNVDIDTYEVSGFLQSLPHVTCTVQFDASEAYVVARSGICEKTYDQHAIQAVQSALIDGMVD